MEKRKDRKRQNEVAGDLVHLIFQTSEAPKDGIIYSSPPCLFPLHVAPPFLFLFLNMTGSLNLLLTGRSPTNPVGRVKAF